jgi:hypothetical protein
MLAVIGVSFPKTASGIAMALNPNDPDSLESVIATVTIRELLKKCWDKGPPLMNHDSAWQLLFKSVALGILEDTIPDSPSDREWLNTDGYVTELTGHALLYKLESIGVYKEIQEGWYRLSDSGYKLMKSYSMSKLDHD